MSSFFTQIIPLKNHFSRLEYFKNVCNDKTVLHVGCTDYPIFDKETNLHLKLAPFCRSLAGFDIDIKGIQVLFEHCPGDYYWDVSQIKNTYDLVIVPEVIEHVVNVEKFLSDLNKISFKEIVVSAPNAFMITTWNGSRYNPDGTFTEIVHPDHKCWFSPYTLKNTVEGIGWKINEIGTLENTTMVFVRASKE